MTTYIWKEEYKMTCYQDDRYRPESDPSGFRPSDVAKEGDFVLRTGCDVFNEAKPTFPGLKSANIRILHEKNDPYLYFRFQTTKDESSTSPWSNSKFRTLQLEISFKSMAPGESQGKCHFIRGFSVPLNPMGKLYYPPGMELYLMEKLCLVDKVKDYIYCKNIRSLRRTEVHRCLNVQIVMKFTNDDEAASKNIVKIKNPMSSMKKMLVDGTLSDFIVSAGGKKFPCHKSILSVQSDVFSAMFESNMKEANSQELKMKDMTSDGVAAFLQFLYCRDLEAAVSNVSIGLELLRAGHKYHVEDLESECKKLLASMNPKKIDAQTAIEIFEFCMNVGDLEELQENVARAFKKNADKYDENGELLSVLSSAKPQTVAKLFKLVASL